MLTSNSIHQKNVKFKDDGTGHLKLKDKDDKIIKIKQRTQINFKAPKDYEMLGIRVFEESQAAAKTAILNSFASNPAAGIALFDSQWGGKASSDREFQLVASGGDELDFIDNWLDGHDPGGKEASHSYIVEYKTPKGETYLFDPIILNRDPG